MLTFTRGDGITLPLRLRNRQGAYVDLTGATFEGEVLDKYGQAIILANDLFTPNADQVSAGTKGKLELELESDTTIDFLEGRGCELVVRVSQNGTVVAYRARILEILPPGARRPR